MLDPKTGRIRVRYVGVESEMYQTLAADMIRPLLCHPRWTYYLDV